jgi:NhaA family Na+:H+ antiporter
VHATVKAWQRFIQIETASGVVLLGATLVALIWANSPWAPRYFALIEQSVSVSFGGFTVARSAQWLINDGLMVIFFFVVGLEIRRETKQGVLSTWRGAALPTAAALGGMLMPAVLYLSLAGQPSTRSGWAIPTATDIAFAIGIVTLLGKRVPSALRVLLLALAVIDDLGAIVIIALFYSSTINPLGLLLAAGALATVLGMQRWAIRSPWLYVIPGIVVWLGIYNAGIHPTIAGVALGLLTPVTSAADGTPSPTDRLIDALHPYVAFAIMPLFALVNAGVAIGGAPLDATSSRVVLAIVVGLVLGKPIGVLLASALTLKLGLATLPSSLQTRHLCLLGVVAGIGFTMALFVAQLSFSDATQLAAAKLGILIASALAAVLSVIVGRLLFTRDRN